MFDARAVASTVRSVEPHLMPVERPRTFAACKNQFTCHFVLLTSPGADALIKCDKRGARDITVDCAVVHGAAYGHHVETFVSAEVACPDLEQFQRFHWLFAFTPVQLRR